MSALVLAVSLVLFVPAFIQAGSSFGYDWYQYSEQIGLVLEYAPVLLAALAVMVLGAAITR